MKKRGGNTYKERDTYYIYTIKNIITKKIYVGCTMSMKGRMQQHLYMLEHGKHPKKEMQSDFNKYGKESFDAKVFTSCKNKQRASALETFTMKVLKSQEPEFGYNVGDRKGNSPLAKADKWRTPVWNWSNGKRSYYFRKYGILLPPEYT